MNQYGWTAILLSLIKWVKRERNIFVQFFPEKNGIDPLEIVDLYQHITENCKNLTLKGLMTIGRFGYDYSQGPNPDFLCLLDCRDRLYNAFKLEADSLEISMGMSDDFEHAVSGFISNNHNADGSNFGLSLLSMHSYWLYYEILWAVNVISACRHQNFGKHYSSIWKMTWLLLSSLSPIFNIHPLSVVFVISAIFQPKKQL